MDVLWINAPGFRNKPFAVIHAIAGDYYFSLCRRQDSDDPYPFRLFVYCDKGYKSLGGFHSIEAAQAFVTTWEDND